MLARRKFSAAVVGSHGYRANYGGWDQLVNNLVDYAGEFGKTLIIYNSRKTPNCVMPSGSVTRNFGIDAHGGQGLIFDFLSVLDSFFRVDAIIFLGAQGLPLALLLRALTRKKVRFVVNPGGIEWSRPKFGRLARMYLRFVFMLAARYSDSMVLDNQHYLSWVNPKSRHESRFKIIPYGGVIDESEDVDSVMESQSIPFTRYFLSVSRALEDNHLVELCSCFERLDSFNLVLVSNFSSSEYGRDILARFGRVPNLHLIDGLYSKPELDAVRRGCVAYIHTHTLCGSAPSLIEMIVCGKPIFSIDVPQNRYTLQGQGAFFLDYGELASLISRGHLPSPPSLELAAGYEWRIIVTRYFDLI
jgi:hypothetical protein